MNRRGAYLKKLSNIESLEARLDLLIQSIKSPAKVTPIVAKSVVKQRDFASLKIEGSKIRSMSLNTMKQLANEIYACHKNDKGMGFDYFDSFRTELKLLLEKETGARTLSAKASRLSKSIDEMRLRLAGLELQNILYCKAYLDIFEEVNKLTKEITLDEYTRIRLINLNKEHRIKYEAILNPNKNDKSKELINVIPFSHRSKN